MSVSASEISGDLYDYYTGEYMMEATSEECLASLAAAKIDGGVGAIDVEGRTCYVVPCDDSADRLTWKEFRSHLRSRGVSKSMSGWMMNGIIDGVPFDVVLSGRSLGRWVAENWLISQA